METVHWKRNRRVTKVFTERGKKESRERDGVHWQEKERNCIVEQGKEQHKEFLLSCTESLNFLQPIF